MVIVVTVGWCPQNHMPSLTIAISGEMFAVQTFLDHIQEDLRDISLETSASHDLSVSEPVHLPVPQIPQVIRSNSLEELQERLQQFNQRRWASLWATGPWVPQKWWCPC